MATKSDPHSRTHLAINASKRSFEVIARACARLIFEKDGPEDVIDAEYIEVSDEHLEKFSENSLILISEVDSINITKSDIDAFPIPKDILLGKHNTMALCLQAAILSLVPARLFDLAMNDILYFRSRPIDEELKRHQIQKLIDINDKVLNNLNTNYSRDYFRSDLIEGMSEEIKPAIISTYVNLSSQVSSSSERLAEKIESQSNQLSSELSNNSRHLSDKIDALGAKQDEILSRLAPR